MTPEETNLELDKLFRSETNVMLEAIIQLAKLAAQNIILVNGMAVISLLTFLGNVMSRSDSSFDAENLKMAFSYFCIGLITGLMVTLFAFLSQVTFRETCFDGRDEKKETKKGLRYRRLAILFGAISLSLFCAGVWFSLEGIFPTYR